LALLIWIRRDVKRERFVFIQVDWCVDCVMFLYLLILHSTLIFLLPNSISFPSIIRIVAHFRAAAFAFCYIMFLVSRFESCSYKHFFIFHECRLLFIIVLFSKIGDILLIWVLYIYVRGRFRLNEWGSSSQLRNKTSAS